MLLAGLLARSPNILILARPTLSVARIFGAVDCSRLRAGKHFLVGPRYGRTSNPAPNAYSNRDPDPNPKWARNGRETRLAPLFLSICFIVPICGRPRSSRSITRAQKLPPPKIRAATILALLLEKHYFQKRFSPSSDLRHPPEVSDPPRPEGGAYTGGKRAINSADVLGTSSHLRRGCGWWV